VRASLLFQRAKPDVSEPDRVVVGGKNQRAALLADLVGRQPGVKSLPIDLLVVMPREQPNSDLGCSRLLAGTMQMRQFVK